MAHQVEKCEKQKSSDNQKGCFDMLGNDRPIIVTRAVAEQLSGEHQLFILKYLHEHQASMNDYLQVFEFYIENGEQWLIQRQEVPERETTVYVELENEPAIDRTVWMMDQGHDGLIILFPEDY